VYSRRQKYPSPEFYFWFNPH